MTTAGEIRAEAMRSSPSMADFLSLVLAALGTDDREVSDAELEALGHRTVSELGERQAERERLAKLAEEEHRARLAAEPVQPAGHVPGCHCTDEGPGEWGRRGVMDLGCLSRPQRAIVLAIVDLFPEPEYSG